MFQSQRRALSEPPGAEFGSHFYFENYDEDGSLFII